MANYNWNMGDWYVWGGLGDSAGNRGAFGVNRSRSFAEFTDGLSNTVMASEVKTYQAVLTTCDLSTVSEPGSIPAPTVDPYSAVPEYRSGSCTLKTTAHAEWVDGQALETGITTAWPPNRAIPVGPTSVDVDLVGRGEKSGGPTYGAITARSYHPGGVNALFGDGTVRFIKSTINGTTWRALGSVQSGEVIAQTYSNAIDPMRPPHCVGGLRSFAVHPISVAHLSDRGAGRTRQATGLGRGAWHTSVSS